LPQHHRILALDRADVRRGLYRSHAEVAKFVGDARAREGAVTLFIRHTSASLTIQENADPTVLVDLTTALNRLAPENAGWRHDTEGRTTCRRTSRRC
jgi:secondary thiamine-phosphate synthase enzyme